MRSGTQIVTVALVIAVCLGGLSATAVADDGETDVEKIGDVDIEIEDNEYHIDGAEITGDGLPSVTIEERTHTVDSLSIQTDGLTVDYGDTTYYVCQLDITVEDVEITLSDISIGEE
ncbi:hypothetical protein CV102_18570 [Natronococcus pandeyae]|uniref:Uncharacterized protein n=1 Tax=Natronococcus pandeyae TaxID=2055836 RepID=A0A8J8TQZ4_9EURY|nr:hypothetical protein [Natronococcus pandeyae]TYL37027.1 hypothetical protein CV102_18570 [Natronococcus pandeyae]